MGSYSEYLDNFLDKLTDLKNTAPTPESVDDLVSEDQKAEFIKSFRGLLRVFNDLSVFTEFNFDDLGIKEQDFEDYKSKYADLYESVKSTEKEKISILDDIDFEIELLKRDFINVNYILQLLKDLDPKKSSYKKDREYIINTISNNPELRSKRELIKQFIDSTLPSLKDKSDIEFEFENFMDSEKLKELETFIKDENLNKDKIHELVKDYEFSGKLRTGILEKSITDELTFMERKKKVSSLKDKVQSIFEKFNT